MSQTIYEKGALIAKAGTKIKEIGLIISGSVAQKSQTHSIILEKGHMIGLTGCDKQEYPADYVAATEGTIVVGYNFHSPDDMKALFESSKDYGTVFTLATLKLVDLVLDRYRRTKYLVRDYYQLVVTTYRDYKYLCSKYKVPEVELKRMEYLTAMDQAGNIPDWQEKYYKRFCKMELGEIKLLLISPELCVGTIMQAGAFISEMITRIDEFNNYLEKTKSILLVPKRDDLFQLVFDLEGRVSYLSDSCSDISECMQRMITFLEKSVLYPKQEVSERVTEYKEYDFAEYIPPEERDEEEADVQVQGVWQDEVEEAEPEEQLTCLEQIMKFGGFEPDAISDYQEKLKAFAEVPDKTSTDSDVRRLRNMISQGFYKCYKECVKTALTQGSPSPIINMFLHFGFMDVGYVGGEETAGALYDLTERLFACNKDKVMTFYEWLKSIYNGENEPSINELDMDFVKYIKEEIRSGNIAAKDEEAYKTDPWRKVEFEIDNVFKSCGKITSGHITSFVPVLSEEDIVSSVENMLVTEDKITRSINEVKAIDYGLFYREVMFSDEAHGVPREYINQEVMPNVILLPNAGTKGMMWQPTAGVRNNTSARFFIPILTTTDIFDIILENCGRYRWEMCRKVQGSRWNDITTPSLTSEYSDYIQYYRKNTELSPEAKEKIHNAIKRARNNNREVFTKDYELWIKYEAKGSFRLNKVAREILFTYCPFSAESRNLLKDNPMFQDYFNRYNIQTKRKVKRLNTLYTKYQQAGGTITPELAANMEYYSL